MEKLKPIFYKMKKLLFLAILFIAQISFAQYYKAEVTLSDGSTKSGYAEPVTTEKSSINFKSTLDGKKEKLELKNLQKVNYTDEKTNKTAEVERLMASQGKMSSEAFLYLIYKGDVSVYAQSQNFYDRTMYNNIPVTSSETSYFFRYKDEKKVTLISMNFGGPGIVVGGKSITKKGIKEFFGDKCPKLVTAYENDEIKFKKDVSVFIDYYEKNCK